MWKCEICQGEIADNEAAITFSTHKDAERKTRETVAAHHCCFVDNLLFEVFGALVLGVKYQRGCAHQNNSDDFAITFVSRELSKATTKLVIRNIKTQDVLKRAHQQGERKPVSVFDPNCRHCQDNSSHYVHVSQTR